MPPKKQAKKSNKSAKDKNQDAQTTLFANIRQRSARSTVEERSPPGKMTCLNSSIDENVSSPMSPTQSNIIARRKPVDIVFDDIEDSTNKTVQISETESDGETCTEKGIFQKEFELNNPNDFRAYIPPIGNLFDIHSNCTDISKWTEIEIDRKVIRKLFVDCWVMIYILRENFLF